MPLGTKLNGTFRAFIEAQSVFFVATAAETGRVNLSPKGGDTLRILDDNRVLWLSLSGSGNETAGHLKRLNRMTLMFCAFQGDARILRLYGTARTIHARDDDWDDLIAHFPAMAGTRQLYDMTIDAMQTSCGSGVPFMSFDKERLSEELVPYFGDMGPDGVDAYWRKKNVETIDGFETGLFED